MRAILLQLEVSVSNPSNTSIPVVKVGNPDYVFTGDFDKDDDKSFSAMCDLEYKVTELAKSFKALGYRVSVLRKEISHLDLD